MSAAKRRTPDRETITTERVALVVHQLCVFRGRKFTTAEIATFANMTHSGAWRLLSRASRVIPIAQEIDGWYMPADCVPD